MKKKVYISLWISRLDKEEVYRQSNDAYNRLTLLGYDAISPLDDGLPEDAPSEQHIKKNIQTLMDCDAIYVCSDYEISPRCALERRIADALNIPRVYYHMNDERIKGLIG